jgi:tetratricopeptide (TPR) repeat protein
MRLSAKCVVIFSAFLIVSSCAGKKGRVAKDAGSVSTESKVQSNVKEQLAFLLERRRYDEALNLITWDIKSGKDELIYAKEYSMAINGMIFKGKKHLGSSAYEKSGSVFRRVLDDLPKNILLINKIVEKEEKIKGYILLSSEKLMEKGLEMYREGNLGEAVLIWKKILKFNPDFAEAKRAIETASIQIDSLNSFEKGDH